jgi:hypothetical protein
MILSTVASIDNDRLRKLAEKHLYIKTDAKSHIKDIPAELQGGTYRGGCYLSI